MLLQTGRGLEGMSSRQALNVTFAWLVTRTPEEWAATKKVLEALSDEITHAEDATVSDLSQTDIESLLDSL